MIARASTVMCLDLCEQVGDCEYFLSTVQATDRAFSHMYRSYICGNCYGALHKATTDTQALMEVARCQRPDNHPAAEEVLFRLAELKWGESSSSSLEFTAAKYIQHIFAESELAITVSQLREALIAASRHHRSGGILSSPTMSPQAGPALGRPSSKVMPVRDHTRWVASMGSSWPA